MHNEGKLGARINDKSITKSCLVKTQQKNKKRIQPKPAPEQKPTGRVKFKILKRQPNAEANAQQTGKKHNRT